MINSQLHPGEGAGASSQLLHNVPDLTNLHAGRPLREKSTVLHPGLDLGEHDACAGERIRRSPRLDAPIVLWNRRWDHDKNPRAFSRIRNRLDDGGDFQGILAKGRGILARGHVRDQPAHFDWPERARAYDALLEEGGSPQAAPSSA